MAAFRHRPVMLEEVMNGLAVKSNGFYVDCTVGGGGHASEILLRSGPRGRLLGLDRDPHAIAAASERLKSFAGRFVLVRASFEKLEEVLREQGVLEADGFLFDLGVSSHQLDEPLRGFSYRFDCPLDMRMDPSQELTAEVLVNEMPERELAAVIKNYGEERWAARIARFIAEERARCRIKTTGQLAEIIKKAIPAPARRRGPNPARRTFQALRIAVNRELEALKAGLEAAVRYTRPGGRICVISFHSLEDRIVKEVFESFSRSCSCPPGFPVCVCGKKAELKIITRKPLLPSSDEAGENPRARSAKLRVAEKLPV